MIGDKGRWRPYPAYRDSDVEWLGEIPAHWRVERVKYIAPESRERLDAKPDDLTYLGLENIESQTGRLLLDAPIEIVESTVVSFHDGDVLFGKLRPYLAKVVQVDFVGVCSTEILVLRPVSETDSRYIFYHLLSEGFIASVNAQTYGTKMPRANGEQIANMRVCLPLLSEQKAIVTFLDRETARIDMLIAKKRQLIERLQEQRIALLSQAVTKGLDSSVPMSDSGIPWLGMVPAHWEVVQLRRFKCLVQTGPFGSQLHAEDYVEGGFPVVNPANIADGAIQADWRMTVDSRTRQALSRHVLQIGDLVLGRRGELGRAALVGKREEGWLCGTGSILIRVKDDRLDPHFLATCLQLPFMKDYLTIESVGSTMDNLNASIVYRMPVVVPPVNEQHRILEHCETLSGQLLALTNKIGDGVATLTEYRSVLISVAITGKIDVRGTVA